ncbi:MAG TPA: hypothetical protein VK735_05020 [Pseudonocardia sp.]|uniref:hypothetical protein n=1 Tax=Pseudonocardia sp. TaxID=60912 RepID=UPI002BAF4718|nr:hypothetical protein [Pseudonocardia sp.]HTF46792.1 hypothetical protein [Pseudonocardia sp.]
MTRYVLTDVEQVGAELSRRAAEVASWLDAAAGRAPPAAPGSGESELAAAIAQVDLACYQALSAAAARLASAAESVAACADAVRTVDAELVERMCRWVG